MQNVFWSKRQLKRLIHEFTRRGGKKDEEDVKTTYRVLDGNELKDYKSYEWLGDPEEYYGEDIGYRSRGNSSIELFLLQVDHYTVQVAKQKKERKERGVILGIMVITLDSIVFGDEITASLKVESIGIHPDHRSTEYGSFLMHEMERYVKRFMEKQNQSVSHLYISLESVFPDLRDDRTIHFYKRLKYEMMGIALGPMRMRKKIALKDISDKQITLKECAKEHVLYEINDHENTSNEIANMLLQIRNVAGMIVMNNDIEGNSLIDSKNQREWAEDIRNSYNLFRHWDACRRYQQSIKYRDMFPELKYEIAEWRSILKDRCVKSYGLEQYTEEQQNKQSYQAKRKWDSFQRRLKDEQEKLEDIQRRMFMKQIVYEFPVNRLTGHEIRMLSQQQKPFVITQSFLFLKMVPFQSFASEMDEKDKQKWKTAFEEHELSSVFDTPLGNYLIDLVEINERDDESLGSETNQFTVWEVRLPSLDEKNDNDSQVFTMISGDFDALANRIASLLTNKRRCLGDVLVFPGGWDAQNWIPQTKDERRALNNNVTWISFADTDTDN
jgi:hypothetical protein